MISPVRGGKTKTGVQFNVQKQPALDSGSTPLAKKLHSDTTFESSQDDRKSYWCGSSSSADSKEKLSHGVAYLLCCSLLLHQHHLY